MPTLKSLTVVLATYNEAQNLSRCLSSVKNLADEIIIVDGSSTDSTRQIAKTFGARIKRTTNKPIFHINKQMAIDLATTPWILQLDADEVIPPALAREIKTVIASDPTPNAFWIKRQNYFLGRFLKKGGQYPDPVIRLFRRGYAHLPQQDVHEQMVVKGQTGTLNHPMEHYTAPTFKRYLTNANRYTSLTAQKLQAQNFPLNPFSTMNYLFIKPARTFLSLYLRHKGFLDGYPGFVFALFSGLHHPIAFIKYYELKLKKQP